MTPTVALSPVNRLWLERFTDLSGHGLFAAPWTATAAGGTHRAPKHVAPSSTCPQSRADSLPARWSNCSRWHHPICAGAEADRQSALALINEPAALISRLEALPYQILSTLNRAKSQAELHENLMNLWLTEVRERHVEAFQAALVWVVANLALLSTLPLNAVYFTSVPWSVPFLLSLFGLWWWTYTRPYRDGYYFFTWLSWSKNQSLARFCEAAAAPPNPLADFSRQARSLLEDGRRDRDRLSAFYLFALPPHLDSVGEAEKMERNGVALLSGTWMTEFDDHHPCPVVDATAAAPFTLPHAVRVWYGTSAH